jgi:hypothetical protein
MKMVALAGLALFIGIVGYVSVGRLRSRNARRGTDVPIDIQRWRS